MHLALAAVLLPLTLAASPPPLTEQAVADQALGWLTRYLQIDTTVPPGNELRGARFFADVLARSPDGRVQLKVNGLRRRINGTAFQTLEQDADSWCWLMAVAMKHARGPENGICAEIDSQVSAGMFCKLENA